MENASAIIEQVLTALPTVSTSHKINSPIYKLFNDLMASHIRTLFSSKKPQARNFGPFGPLLFPYHEMGAINSLHLFGLDELIIFSFYWANRKRYSKVLDIGANLGLHSLMMSRAGFEVHAYEPDSTHFKLLKENIVLNKEAKIHINNAAVSNRSGRAEFVRVLGNTTSSHLAGSKLAYGALEKYEVDVVDIQSILKGVDLIKMDVEGHEKNLLLSLTPEQYKKTDILVEIGSAENAKSVFNYLNKTEIHLFAQNKGWGKVTSLEEMPTSYRDGTLFISAKSPMPWPHEK